MTGLAPVEETTPLAPMSPYGRSKLMTEWMLADVAAAHPIKYGVLRYFNVAGADPAGSQRPVDAARHAPHQGRGADGARAARKDGHLRHRLSDARRHLRARLHPRHRPDRGAQAAARPSARGRRQHDAQLRLWPGLFGARRWSTRSRRCRASISASTRARAGPAIRPRSRRPAKPSGSSSAGCRSTTTSTRWCAPRSIGSAI